MLVLQTLLQACPRPLLFPPTVHLMEIYSDAQIGEEVKVSKCVQFKGFSPSEHAAHSSYSLRRGADNTGALFPP